jgi:molybdenum transport protein
MTWIEMALDDAALAALLREDAPHGDLTTRALGIGGRPAALVCRARHPQVAACTEEAARLVTLAGGCVAEHVPSGTGMAGGDLLLRATGPAGAILLAWKVAQTLMEYAAGIATATAAIVEAAQAAAETAPVVACTRKTFPGTRALSAKAVRAGGGVLHRAGLSETILVFPEHGAFLDGPVADWLSGLRDGNPEKRVVVECADVAAALRTASAGADVVQLEKFSPDEAFTVVRHVHAERLACRVAAAGGLTPQTAGAYARAGVDILVTSWPYFAPPRDVAVTISAA